MDSARLQARLHRHPRAHRRAHRQPARQNGNIVKANDDNPIVVINQVHPIYVSFAVPEQNLTEIKKYHRTAGGLHVDRADCRASRRRWRPAS